MSEQLSTLGSTQNTAALMLQNQNDSNSLKTSQLGLAATSADPLQAAWSKMIYDLKVDFNAFAVPASKEINQGAAAIAQIAGHDFQNFSSILGKNIKTQVDSLTATLMKEVREDLKPQLQILADKMENNLTATSQRALSDMWDHALPIIIDTAKISLATLGSGQGFTPAALATIAVQVMQTPDMKELTAELNKELKAGLDTAVKDLQSSWTAIQPTLNGEIKTALVTFGAAVIAETTIQSAIFSANMAKDIAVEVAELHKEYGNINKQNLTTITKDLLTDAGKVVSAASKKVVSGAKSLASKIRGLFR